MIHKYSFRSDPLNMCPRFRFGSGCKIIDPLKVTVWVKIYLNTHFPISNFILLFTEKKFRKINSVFLFDVWQILKFVGECYFFKNEYKSVHIAGYISRGSTSTSKISKRYLVNWLTIGHLDLRFSAVAFFALEMYVY